MRGWGGLLWVSTSAAPSKEAASTEEGEARGEANVQEQDLLQNDSDTEEQRSAAAREFVALLAAANRSSSATDFYDRQKKNAAFVGEEAASTCASFPCTANAPPTLLASSEDPPDATSNSSEASGAVSATAHPSGRLGEESLTDIHLRRRKPLLVALSRLFTK